MGQTRAWVHEYLAPVEKRFARSNSRSLASNFLLLAQQDRYIIRVEVGNGDVLLPIAVEIAHGY
jgi:hypothetical protein